MTVHVTPHQTTASRKNGSARLATWSAVLNAVAAMRERLDARIRFADPDDIDLATDVKNWSALAQALAAHLAAKGAA